MMVDQEETVLDWSIANHLIHLSLSEFLAAPFGQVLDSEDVMFGVAIS